MPLLHVDNISIRFGGLKALSNFSLSLDAGDLVGLIGPNGAGKTTAFNAITGVYPPTAGAITLEGKRIDEKAVAEINRAGVARTFQNIRLFQPLSVLDNVAAGMNHSCAAGLCKTLFHTPDYTRERRRLRDESMELLRALDLDAKASMSAGNLPYGDQRRLEIARALATRPKVLLLDEPAAGMNPAEKGELMKLIHHIRDRFGVGILLIEHDMKLVMNVCQCLTVLDHGETIAVGSPAMVRSDPKVIEAYLGEQVENSEF